MTASRYSEFMYRKLFGLTHEQYLDEPLSTVQWMVRIDGLVKAAEAERRRA